MRIAVIGGGTAGFIAATHLTAKVPEAELLHVFDSSLPTIGVGEGTTPRFPGWFQEVTGLGFAELEARCRATLKEGTVFEGWGARGLPFVNRFQPTYLIGYHFNASDVVKVLADHVEAQRIDATVEALSHSREGVAIRVRDGREYMCDYVFDARGFPRRAQDDGTGQDELLFLNWIPTNRAIVGWCPPDRGCGGTTRAVARPHGWVFRIPLQDRTSLGYVFNATISADAEVESDFDALLEEEGIPAPESRRALSFPNFARKRWFDGRVFHVGNSASFVEPLEATAIGTAIVQVRTAVDWIREHDAGADPDPTEVEAVNRSMTSYIVRNSLFIAWHYACGSRWDTPFWSHARGAMERAQASPVARSHLTDMQGFIDAGRALPGHDLPSIVDQAQWDREVYPLLKVFRPFGNFSELNFAQVGHGMGLYDVHGGHGSGINHFATRE